MSSQSRRFRRMTAVGALAGLVMAPVASSVFPVDEAQADDHTTINLLGINDFHGRIDENTVAFAGTVEQLREEDPDSTLLVSGGDNVGASVYASAVQDDEPTVDVLNALDMDASATGNHEYDQGLDDVTDRLAERADFSYLAANVYEEGTEKPVLDEYDTFEIDGFTVGVIGAVTQETPTLVRPSGIEGLDFGDPVEAVNRVADDLTDGDPSNGEADVLVATFHEGAPKGESDGADVDGQMDSSDVFREIAADTSDKVSAIFTGHTHKAYAWEYDGRPIIQTGSYGANVGQIVLDVDGTPADADAGTAADVDVSVEKYRNVSRTETDDQELIDAYPRVAEVDDIVDDALAVAEEEGSQVIGEATGDITTAFTYPEGEDPIRDDRGSESTLGNLVANAMRETLSDEDLGGADIGVVNPGGLRAELREGDITVKDANAVLPFNNNLGTTTLTGEQVKAMLEQQWQRTDDGSTPSRDYLQLGLSDNVTYTYDPDAERDHHITTVTIDGEPLDPEQDYTIGTFAFLQEGGDNFHVFRESEPQDSGLVDRDAWMDYIEDNSPLSPSFDRRSVAVTGIPTDDVTAGEDLTLEVSQLDMTSLGSPEETELTAEITTDDEATGDEATGDEAAASATPAALGTSSSAVEPTAVTPSAASAADTDLGTTPVTDGAATVEVTVPDDIDGAATLTLTGEQTGTVVTVPLSVVPADSGQEPGTGGDDSGESTGGGSGDGAEDGSGSSGDGAAADGGSDSAAGNPDGGGQGAGDAADDAADGELPWTGVDTAAVVGAGILAVSLLVAGAIALIVARRRAAER